MENSSLRALILKNRSYRRFYHNSSIELSRLKQWIDLARNSASAKNKQPLKYIAVSNETDCAEIFRHLAWAAYLKDWDGPVPEERPSAYVVMLFDKNISEQLYCDHGIAAQSILLAAVEDGFGGCILAAINRKAVMDYFKIPANLEIIQILALGKPKETVVLKEVGEDGNTNYYRDQNMVHFVPKRSLDEIIYMAR